jgi:ribosome biogenesis GTPase A
MGQTVTNLAINSSRDQITEVLVRVRDICSAFQIVSLNRRIESYESLLTGNQLIDIAVLGQFKAGKSSFLNSLAGESILPVGVTPVTTTIIRLRYGKKARAVVRHFDGQEGEVDLAAIEDFTSEARNPANQKDVEFVDIELPSLKEYAGLRFVDTPGLGSVFKYHRKLRQTGCPRWEPPWSPSAPIALWRRTTSSSFGI